MRRPLPLLFLLTATLLGMGLIGEAWRGGKPESAQSAAVNAVKPLDPSVLPPVLPGFSEGGSVTLTTPEASASPAPTELALSADDNALVAEMCNLQLLSSNTPLTLNSQQWSVLAGLVLRTQAIRHALEAQLATSTVIAPGLTRVEIPVYASAGDVLRENFYTGLRNELGAAAAADILGKIGDRLEGRFAGFGVSAQMLEISGDPVAALSEVKITRTVTYWNSVEGSDRLTTRREIHFPAWEDPAGECWSELLALVKA